MRKFFIKSFILITLLVSPIYAYVLVSPMSCYSYEYPLWLHQKNVANKVEDIGYADILIMGDSRTMTGVHPRMISSKAYSLTLGGATPLELYYILKKYLTAHAKTPEVVFLALAPSNLEHAKMFWQRTVKYNFLNMEEYYEIFGLVKEHKENISKYDASESYNDFNSIWVPYLDVKLAHSYIPEIQISIFVDRKKRNLNAYKLIKENRGQYYFGTDLSSDGLNVESERRKFIPSRVLNEYLVKLLDLCRDNDIKVIYDILPMNEASFERLFEDYTDGYTKYIHNVFSLYPEASYSPSINSYPNSYFGDESHLNESGAIKYSHFIKNKYFADYR